MNCGPELIWDLGLVGQAHALLVCNPGSSLLWALELGLTVGEGNVVFPGLLWDSCMILGYCVVGVILFDPDSGVLIWIKIFSQERVGVVINGCTAGLYLIVMLNNVLLGSVYGALIGVVDFTISMQIFSHFTRL